MGLGRLLIDVDPLRTPPFRRMWLGSLVSAITSQMAVLAVLFQVWEATDSVFAVGAIGLAAGLPTIAFGLFGGALVDALERRRIMLIATVAQQGIAGALFLQALVAKDAIWGVYVLIAMQSLIGSVSGPARRTYIRTLLRPGQIQSGITLNLFAMNLGAVIGPLLGGAVIAGLGVQFCYLAFGLTIPFVLYTILRLPRSDPGNVGSRRRIAFIGEGVMYVARDRVLRGVFLADLSVTVFGSPIALLPALNSARFGGSAETLGYLTGAIAIGGIAATFLSGPLLMIDRPGVGILMASLAWSTTILLLAFANAIGTAIVCLFLAGAFDVMSLTLFKTIVQKRTPERLLGRVTAAEFVTTTGGPQLGNVRNGIVGSFVSPPVAILLGAISSLAMVALVFTSHRALWNSSAKESTSDDGSQPIAEET